MAKMKQVIIPYKPRYPEIHERLESCRFSVLVAHRRFGKTVLSVNHLLKQALLCAKPRGSFAYVAPFRNQAKVVAWDYLKHYSAPIPGRAVNESELCITVPSNGGGSRVRIFGADNPDALRGLYFDGVILDEVAQMKSEVWEEVIRPALSDRQGWAVFIGTPKGVNLFSELYNRAVRLESEGDPDWAALCFPVTKTDVIPAGEVEKIRMEQSDNKFRQEYLCDFTASTDDTLIPLDLLEEADVRRVSEEEVRGMPLIFGVDVARFGADASVVFMRRGLLAMPPKVFRGLDNMALADQVAVEIVRNRPQAVFIDAGQGSGVIDRLRQLGHRHLIVEVPFGSRALSENRFINRRSEMWFGVREWLIAGGALPCDQEHGARLRAELTAPLYWFDAAGRIVMEPKEKIKERLGFSPDIADALALTFAQHVEPEGASVMRNRRVKSESSLWN